MYSWSNFRQFSWLILLFALSPVSNGTPPIDLEPEARAEYDTLADDLGNAARFQSLRPETLHPAALIETTDRDPLDIILRRTHTLLDDIRRLPGAPDMNGFAEQLATLEATSAALDPANTEQRFDTFKKVHALRRMIAFANPLLDFDKILFIKRDRAMFEHMCDQYYGTHAVPGGGIFVLSDPFGSQPQAIDLLANTSVAAGRLKGTKLEHGGFLSPELSFDAKTVLFAWVECTGDPGHIDHLDHPQRGHWTQGRCYHLFSAEIDPVTAAATGAGNLRQLTDGTFNDFDPCFLPGGRVAFITERRGGYLRCGRACPSYTVFDMRPDGSDIRVLSPHENNEWQPSVTHEGMIIYTRWDYVDRHGCTAHHPWLMTPDGRDSRALHGNFSVKARRPDMEMDLRAIPGSKKFIGTAAPHHGQTYGSLVLIDPQVPDDDAMAPVKRVTPDVGFPESQGGSQVYGTPWPLSENYHLCVYDAAMRGGGGKQAHQPGNYGIYLVDAFGNKELIYRDPSVACLSPMPLRPRPMPPALPDQSQRLAENPPASGTMAVMNVYDSLKPWPADTRIESLRIIQIHPSSVPSGYPPHETGRRIAEAGDSVNLARSILGTVPVEKDGSASFTVPALKEVYFQALDADGLAIQSMRSSTWVQPGETLTCHGCHEPKDRAPAQLSLGALALRRPPSVPKPDVDGTNPFSYPRLVQPVLDRKCTACHAETRDQGAPPLDREIVVSNLGSGGTRVFRSYDSLIHKFAFWQYGDPYRTAPGAFGAKASKLYQLLDKGHHDVELTPEERHRISVWLDSLSNFYGVYEKAGGEAQLRGEIAHPTLE